MSKAKWFKGGVISNPHEVLAAIMYGQPLYVADRWTSAAFMMNWPLITILGRVRMGHFRVATENGVIPEQVPF